MNDFRVWLAGTALLVAGWLLYPSLAGDRFAPVRDEERPERVFVCRESGDVFVLRAQESVETHPRTGKTTLMPGLYCAQCGKWRASPPLAVLQQSESARQCPVHHVPLQCEGPLPNR